MNRTASSSSLTLRTSLAAILACAVALCWMPPAQAAGHTTAARACDLDGTWLGGVDIGAQFFTQYSGATLTLEWILFDPTLFGTFPTAVRITPGMGAWERTRARAYDYTWIAYGLNAAGQPLYAIKVSGSGTFSSCDLIRFDYVIEVFPTGLDPLTDAPVTCISGTGTKRRIPVTQGSCP